MVPKDFSYPRAASARYGGSLSVGAVLASVVPDLSACAGNHIWLVSVQGSGSNDSTASLIAGAPVPRKGYAVSHTMRPERASSCHAA